MALLAGGVDSAWFSLLRDFGAWELLSVLSTREIRDGWIFPFESFGVFGGLAPLEVDTAAGEVERLRFEVTGTGLAGFVSSESEEVPEDEDTEGSRWRAEDNLV